MASAVHFKFKSQKEPSRVTFDGTAISVFDLKREIINVNKLGDGSDFELAIYNENDSTEYDDDTSLIPRSTSVIARRLPPLRPGRGGAARYVSGKAPINARHSSFNSAAKINAPAVIRGPDMSMAQTEEERVKAMFSLEGEQWRLKQQEMATEQRVPFGPGKGLPKKNANIPEGEPPRGYVCYRCGKKGHWIQACPTNDDPNFEGKARIKRTTGIPRSMLKTIDKSELDNLDETTRQQMMINGDGDYVIAQTDEKEWKKHQERVKASAAAQEKASRGDQELQSRGLECPIDQRLFVDPVKTPCCQRTYCNECVSTALIDSDLTCPNCSTENVTLEELVSDHEAQDKIKAFQAEKADDVKKGENDDAESVASNPDLKGAPPPKIEAAHRSGNQSPSYESPLPLLESKKRGADDITGSSTLAPLAMEMKRQRSDESHHDSKMSSQKNTNGKQLPPDNAPSPAANYSQMMPPDMSQMMQGFGNPNASFQMPISGMPGMAGMAGMPFIPNMDMNANMMNPGMMGMPGAFLPANFNMNGLNGMNGMNGINGMNGMGFNNGMNFPTPSNNVPQDLNLYRGNYHQQKTYPHHDPHATKMQGVPTGPRNHPIPSGLPTVNKFSNQQRPLGREEDNAYARQPVNPHRHQNRLRRVRPSDYRELGS